MAQSFRRPSLAAWAAAAAVVGGAALRLHHLSRESVWLDEAYSIDLARRSVVRILAEGWLDIHPPLYYLALHFWIPLAGHTEFGARLLSVVFDVGTIAATYLVGGRLAGTPAAALAAAMVALSPLHVEFAQEARMYALLGLLGTLSMGAFTALPRGGVRAPATLAVATALLLYTHVHGFFIVAAEAVALAIWWGLDRTASRRAIGPWLWAMAGAAMLYLPWTMVLLDQVTRVQSSFWVASPPWSDGLTVFASYAGSGAAAGVLGIFATVAVGKLTRGREPGVDIPPAIVLLPWVAVPVLVPLIASRISTPIFLPKYTIAASIPFAILAAAGVMRVRPRALAAALAAVVLVLAAWPLESFYASRRRDGWRETTARLESLAHPNDLVLFYPWFNQYPFDYYRRRADLVERAFPLAPDVPVPGPAVLSGLAREAVGDARRVWFVVLQGAPEKEPIARSLGRELTPTGHIVSHWIELYRFERQP